jgi:parvulin-like peptidyl-prolyl isomerase
MAVFQKQFFQFKVALSDQKIDLNTEEGRAALAQVRLQVLNSLIELALIEQAASRMGIAITDDQLNTRVQETIAAGGGDEKFQAWLVESGITLEEFRDQLRAEMLTEAVIHQITNAVSDKTEQVHARHILLGSEDKAQEALRRVQAGEDFATVAREMSVDDITRTEGGDLGFFPKGMLSVPREVEDAAFALQPGQVSGVVRSPYGFHIIQVVERQSDRVLQPDVYQAMKQKSFDEWLQRERATAQVEILIPME